MAIEVKLQAFEGPLDLLLHLIEKNKIDIYDIPIAEITDQYLDYVRQEKETEEFSRNFTPDSLRGPVNSRYMSLYVSG